MKSVSKYKPGQEGKILLNANESTSNLDPMIIEEIKKQLDEVDFNRYPEDGSKKLIKAYANYLKLSEDEIIAGNGSDEMLGLLIGLNISKDKKLYTLERDFGMYDYYTSMHGGEVVTFPQAIDEDFNVENFCKLGRELSIDIIMFSNPNNPTGNLIELNDIKIILESFRDKIVVVDEAYIEFSKDNSSAINEINNYPNLIVTRTLSKAFGLAGIRCGFMITNRLLMNKIKEYKVPYNVNRLTQLVGEVCLNHYGEFLDNIQQIKKERARVYQEVQEMNKDSFILYPSQANFLYGTTPQKEKLLKAFKDKGITIRNYEDDSFRISIGNSSENDLVLEVLKSI